MKQNYMKVVMLVSAWLMLGIGAISAQEHYRFVPTDYVSTDDWRAPQSAFSYDAESFTITASGQNNVAFKMGAECDGKYFISRDDH